MAKSLLAISFGAEKARPLRRSLKRIGHLQIFQPGVRSAYLDTGRGGRVSANVAILSLRVPRRNGSEGLELALAPPPSGVERKKRAPPVRFLRKNVIPGELVAKMM